MERYWQEATKLELACAERDWDGAQELLRDLLAIRAEDWMRETTINNLKIQKQAFSDDGTAIKTLDEIVNALIP